MAFLCGDLEEAERLSQEALEYLPRSVSPYGRALALSIQANIARARGDSVRAAELCHERLNLPADAWSLRWSLEELADTAVDLGEMERAARLLGASEALRERIGIILVPSRLVDHETSVNSVRVALAEETFAAAWQEGRAMSDDEARAEASLVGRGEIPSG